MCRRQTIKPSDMPLLIIATLPSHGNFACVDHVNWFVWFSLFYYYFLFVVTGQEHDALLFQGESCAHNVIFIHNMTDKERETQRI